MTDDAALHIPDALDRIGLSHYISPQLSTSILVRKQRANQLHLRDEHLDVLNLIVNGQNNHEIAQIMGYTPRSLYRIRKELRNALGARSNEQLVDEAYKHDLIDQP
jgi:DNA-binding NarL/FixJ family response regulator